MLGSFYGEYLIGGKDSMANNLIVFCPGYSGLPPARFNPLLKKFSKDGFDIVSIRYENFGRGDITDTAKRAIRVTRPLRTYYDHISFIGHSMGGLVARKALNLSPMVGDSLVTIGTPHRGVQGASGAFTGLGGKAALQMRSHSKFLTNLGPVTHPTLTLTGDWDILVPDASVPLHEASLNVKNLKIPRGEHTGMLGSNRVYGEIYSWLTYEVLNTLGTHTSRGAITEVDI